MQATYPNGVVVKKQYDSVHEAFKAGEEHMENGATSVRIFKKADPKRKTRRKIAQASRRRNRK